MKALIAVACLLGPAALLTGVVLLAHGDPTMHTCVAYVLGGSTTVEVAGHTLTHLKEVTC